MPDQSRLINEFKQFYSDFSEEFLPRLPSIYAENVVFTDPVHRLQGLESLDAYFRGMASDLSFCHFHFEEQSGIHPVPNSDTENQVYFVWRMEFSHKSLAGGKSISVRGVSRICFDDKVTFHEDFYDMGAMLYEHLPLFGRLVRFLKRRLAAY